MEPWKSLNKSLNNYKAPGFGYKITVDAIKYGVDELA